MIKDLNLEETDESVKYKERKKLNKEQKRSRKAKLAEETSDLSSKLKGDGSYYKIDLNLRSENVHLLNNNNDVNVKNENDLTTKSQVKPSNQTSLVTSSSDDSYSLDSESSSSSSSDESKSSSTSDLRTMNDFSEKLSDQFDKFDTILCSKCDDDDDVFESNLLTSCNDLSASLNNLCRSNSTICLPTYLDEMYGTLRTSKQANRDLSMQNGNLSTTATPKLQIKSETEQQLTSSQFHKDILLNLQKKSYFYKLINVYPFLFPECCRQQQQCDCGTDTFDRINQTVHSEREFFISNSKPSKPCIHSFSCDYDPKYDAKCNADNQQQTKNVEFKINDDSTKHTRSPPLNNNYIKQHHNVSETISPTTSTVTTTTSTTHPSTQRISLKPLPNKSVGQSLISSFVQLEPGRSGYIWI